MENLNLLLKRLLEAELDFVLIGGYLDEVTAVGSFQDLKSRAATIQIFDRSCKVISLDDLINVNSVMTRAKDKSVLEELLAVRARLSRE